MLARSALRHRSLLSPLRACYAAQAGLQGRPAETVALSGATKDPTPSPEVAAQALADKHSALMGDQHYGSQQSGPVHWDKAAENPATQTVTGVIPSVDVGHQTRDPAEAAFMVRAFYRKCVRALPGLLRAYEMPDEAIAMKTSIYNVRQHFEANRFVTEPHTIDMLRWKGEMELNEALHMFKTKPHIADYVSERPVEFEANQVPLQVTEEAPSQFLDDFFKDK